MLRGAFKQDQKKSGKRRPRFVGLVAVAGQLDVNRNHLYLVLSGRRESASLVAKVKLTPIRNKPGYTKVEVR